MWPRLKCWRYCTSTVNACPGILVETVARTTAGKGMTIMTCFKQAKACKDPCCCIISPPTTTTTTATIHHPLQRNSDILKKLVPSSCNSVKYYVCTEYIRHLQDGTYHSSYCNIPIQGKGNYLHSRYLLGFRESSHARCRIYVRANINENLQELSYYYEYHITIPLWDFVFCTACRVILLGSDPLYELLNTSNP